MGRLQRSRPNVRTLSSTIRKIVGSRRNLIVLVLAFAVGPMLIAGTSSTSTASPSSSPAAKTVTAPSGHFVAPSLYDFELEGDTDFPNVYTGGVREPDGSVTFYVTQLAPDLLAAIEAADTNGTPYRFVIVPHSYAETNSLTMRIAHNAGTLIADGVRFVDFGPDIRTGLVVVNLAEPTNSDLAALAAALNRSASSITIENYPEQVEVLLQSRYGNDVRVAETYKQPAIAANRRNDTAPFAGGDNVCNPQYCCTGGFPVSGDSGTFMTTAAHCGIGTFKIDSTSTVVGTAEPGHQFSPPIDYDVELIGPTDVRSQVWGGSRTAPVQLTLTGGPIDPMIDDPISWDGSNTGEKRNILVTNRNQCVYEGEPGAQGLVCNDIESSNSPMVVQGGDSGGPVYQHTCQTCNTIKPMGTIIAYNTTTAYAQYLGVQLSITSTTVDD